MDYTHKTGGVIIVYNLDVIFLSLNRKHRNDEMTFFLNVILFLIAGVFIVGAKRTAFGTFGGAFKNTSGTQLQTAACKATLDSAGVRPDQVDSVVIGNVLVVSIHDIIYYFSI